MAQPHEASSCGDPRFEAPETLLRHGISCMVWAEDALWRYGVRTVCFDLYLIVEDSETAAKCLESVGYSRALPNPRCKFMPELYEMPRFKKGPFDKVEDERATYVVLVRAEQCHYSLPPANTITDLIPHLPALIDSIIDAWLDATSLSYVAHLETHLAYLCEYCPKTHDPLFVRELKAGHRDFYLRYLSHPAIGAERKEWKRIRDSFLQ